MEAQLQEKCRQSCGKECFLEIDKMEQNSAIVPSIWSQLASPLVKEGDRVQVSLRGMICYGARYTSNHIRTVFENCSHGSEMQSSTIPLNFHGVAMREGRLPEELIIGTDNTAEETKNHFLCWFCMWLLCVLAGTPLWSHLLCCLPVAHTHDEIDRFFSRVKVALAGHDYYTVAQMLEIVPTGLPGFHVQRSHLSHVWQWKGMEECKLPGMGRLGRIHVLKFFRHGGIWVKWKQCMTSAEWSSPVLLIPEGDTCMARVAAWRPQEHELTFKDMSSKLNWPDKFEASLANASWSVGSCKNDLMDLRDIVNSRTPDYQSGLAIDDVISDLRRLGGDERLTADNENILPSD